MPSAARRSSFISATMRCGAVVPFKRFRATVSEPPEAPLGLARNTAPKLPSPRREISLKPAASSDAIVIAVGSSVVVEAGSRQAGIPYMYQGSKVMRSYA